MRSSKHLNITRGFLVVSASAALILSATACGGSDKPTPKPPAKPAAAPVTTVKTCNTPVVTTEWAPPTWTGDTCAYVANSLGLFIKAADEAGMNPPTDFKVTVQGPSDATVCNGESMSGSKEYSDVNWCDTENMWLANGAPLDSKIKENNINGALGAVATEYGRYLLAEGDVEYSTPNNGCVVGVLTGYVAKNGGMTDEMATKFRDLNFGFDSKAVDKFTQGYNTRTNECIA